MVVRADQGKEGTARTAGSLARRGVLAAVSCAALLAGLGAAAPTAVAAGRGHGAATAAVPGSQLWVSRLNGPAASVGGFARAVAVSPDGATVFVTGANFGGGADYETAAYDTATGARLWATRYNGPANRNDFAMSVAVSLGGATVFVTGASFGGLNRACCHSDWDYATVAYDAATGAQRWASRYNGPLNSADQASSVAVSPDGATVFVTGTSGNATVGGDYATVAYDAATGAQRWVSLLHGPAARTGGFARSVAVSPDGATVFVTGNNFGRTSGSDYATVAYAAATGARRWVSRYNGAANGSDQARSVAVSPDGATVFVTGASRGRTSGSDYATVAYNAATGARRWASRYNGPDNTGDGAVSVAVGPGGHSVYVTGTSRGRATGLDYATVAYNAATGAPRWTSRYNGSAGGSDSASSLAVRPGGATVFVTGTSFAGTSGSTSLEDYATVGYNAATGAPLWASRYHGPAGQSDAFALAVSPDGTRVFVTGSTVGETTLTDYATIAYQG